MNYNQRSGNPDSPCALCLCRARRCLHFSSPLAVPLHPAFTVCYSSPSCAILTCVATTLLHSSSELVAFGEPLRSRSELRNSPPLGVAFRVRRGIERIVLLIHHKLEFCCCGFRSSWRSSGPSAIKLVLQGYTS